MSWIDSLLEETDRAETPRAYVYWSGISIISAIISPNVYLNRGGVYKLQPNTFIILIGESGLGKGLPLSIAKKLVKLVGSTRVLSGNNTIQSIIYDLGNSESDIKTGVPKWTDSRGYIVTGEFATLLQEDKQALPVLTEFYDTHYMGDWEKRTKSSGRDKLDKVCVTLFAGSTAEHFQNVVPEHDVKGGFVGRLLTVYEEKRYKINPLTDTDMEVELPFDKWSIHLLKIAQLKGPFGWADVKVRKHWEEWYSDIKDPKRKIVDPTGAINRLPDNVLKVAMCISLSRQTSDLIISYEDLDEAITRCMMLTVDSRRLTGGRGPSQIGQQVHFVTQVLYRAAIEGERVTKSYLLRKYYGHFDVYELDRIISTLEAAGVANSTPIIGGKDRPDIAIEMPMEVVKNLQKMMER